MTKKAMWLPLIGLSVVGMVTLVAWAGDEQEEEVTLEQVPAAVKATILKESAGGRITDYQGRDPVGGDGIIATAGSIHDEVVGLLNPPA